MKTTLQNRKEDKNEDNNEREEKKRTCDSIGISEFVEFQGNRMQAKPNQVKWQTQNENEANKRTIFDHKKKNTEEKKEIYKLLYGTCINNNKKTATTIHIDVQSLLNSPATQRYTQF